MNKQKGYNKKVTKSLKKLERNALPNFDDTNQRGNKVKNINMVGKGLLPMERELIPIRCLEIFDRIICLLLP